MLETNANDFYYGMKRFFDIGCQPSGQKGLCSPELVKSINEEFKPNIEFLDVVRYENELSQDDIKSYELVPLKGLKCLAVA